MTTTPNPRTSRPLGRLLARFILDPIREARLDLDGLLPDQRRVALSAYAAFFGFLLGALILGFIDHELSGPSYLDPEGMTRTISWAAIGLTSLGFVLGWAYLLTGAAQSHWLVFLSGLALFAMLYLPVGLMPALAFAALVILLALLLIPARLRGWLERAPGRVLSAALLLLAAGVAAYWLTGDGAEQAAGAQGGLAFTFWFTEVVWVLAGLAIVRAGASLGQAVVTRLRDGLSAGGFRRLSAAVILLHPPLGLALAFPLLTYGTLFDASGTIEALASVLWYDLFLVLPLAFVSLVMMVIRRWTARGAGLMLSLRLSLFALAVGLLVLQVSDFNLSDPVYAALERLPILPPSFFFMVSLLLTVLAFFIPFARRDSRWFPRRARLPLAFGGALLTTTVMFFFLQARQVGTGQELASSLIVPATFSIGANALGLPYLIYLAFRRRPALIGESAAWEEAALASHPAAGSRRRGLAALVFLLPGLLAGCACCGALAALFLP